MVRALIDQLSKIPNQITAIRFAAVPAMWVFAFLGVRTAIGVGFIIGFITDLLDGMAARKLGQTSDFGSKLDSLADQLLQLSSIVWILMLMPDIITDNIVIALMAISIYSASLFVGLVKFRRIANLHLYLSKAGGFFLYLFLIHAFIALQYNKVLFTVAAIMFILSSSETLALQLISSEVDADTGSIILRYVRDDHPIRRYLSLLP